MHLVEQRIWIVLAGVALAGAAAGAGGPAAGAVAAEAHAAGASDGRQALVGGAACLRGTQAMGPRCGGGRSWLAAGLLTPAPLLPGPALARAARAADARAFAGTRGGGRATARAPPPS
jgi:hypothetical protein